MTTIVFLIAYIGGCLTALRYPLIGVITYLMIYFTYPAMAWWSRPIEWMGIRYAYTAALFTAAGIFINWYRLRPGRSLWQRQEILMLLLLGTMYISMFSGAGPCDTSHRQLDKMFKVFLFVLMLTHVVADLRSYRALVWALAIGTFYLAYQSYTAGPSSFIDGRLNDIGGPDFDRAPELGVHFVVVLPFIAILLLTDTRWSARLFLLAAAALTCNGIVLTRTRSAMTAILVGMVWGLMRMPRNWRSRLIPIGVAGAIGAYALTDQAFWERMSTIPQAIEEQSDIRHDARGVIATSGRLPTWIAAWNMWKDNPFGVGIGNFTRLIENYPPALYAIDAHNTVVLCFAELGILGILTFAAILLTLFGQLRRLKRLAEYYPHLRWLRMQIYALELSILMFVVGGMTVSRFYCEMFWVILAMPVCLERAIYNSLAEKAVVQQAASTDSPVTAAVPAGLRPKLAPA